MWFLRRCIFSLLSIRIRIRNWVRIHIISLWSAYSGYNVLPETGQIKIHLPSYWLVEYTPCLSLAAIMYGLKPVWLRQHGVMHSYKSRWEITLSCRQPPIGQIKIHLPSYWSVAYTPCLSLAAIMYCLKPVLYDNMA